MIIFENCNTESLVSKLKGELSYYPQLPQIQEKYYPHMDVIQVDNTIITIGTKEDSSSIDSIVKSVSFPLGHITQNTMNAIFDNLNGFENIILSCWDDYEHKKSASRALLQTMSQIKGKKIKPRKTHELDFLTQNPQEYPDDLSGKNNYWLRKALRAKEKHNLEIRRLSEEDLFDVLALHYNWCEYKGFGINTNKCENIANIFETYNGHNLQIFGIYNNHKLLAINGIVTYGNKAIQLIRNYIPSKIPAQKIIDHHVFAEMKEQGISQFSIGNNNTQTDELLYYKSKFLPIKTRKRFNYVISLP